MTHTEFIYRKLFEVGGSCKLKEEVVEAFDEMKRSKIVPDKVTFGTYYHAVQMCNASEEQAHLQMTKKNSYLKVVSEQESFKSKQSVEGAEEEKF